MLVIDTRPSRIKEKQKKIEKKDALIEYKGGKCVDCGGVFPRVCMGFDHRDPDSKLFSIGLAMGKPLEELKIEVDKCDLVCANCHAIRTANNPVVARKISESKKGKATRLGIPLSEEHKAKIAAGNIGKPKSAEHVAKCVEGRRLTFLKKKGLL